MSPVHYLSIHDAHLLLSYLLYDMCISHIFKLQTTRSMCMRQWKGAIDDKVADIRLLLSLSLPQKIYYYDPTNSIISHFFHLTLFFFNLKL